MIVFFFLYIPWFQQVISTTTVPFEYFLFPIAYGMGLLILEELVFNLRLLANVAQITCSEISSRVPG
jgi:hypothetical protein